MSDTTLWPVNVARTTMFRIVDSAGAGVTGVVNGDVTKRLYKNQVASAVTVTVTEVANGNYKVSYTPDTADADWDLFLTHATYGGAGWHDSIRCVTALAHEFAEMDETIDTTTTPWDQVGKRKATATEILRKKLKTAASANVTNADEIVGRRTES